MARAGERTTGRTFLRLPPPTPLQGAAAPGATGRFQSVTQVRLRREPLVQRGQWGHPERPSRSNGRSTEQGLGSNRMHLGTERCCRRTPREKPSCREAAPEQAGQCVGCRGKLSTFPFHLVSPSPEPPERQGLLGEKRFKRRGKKFLFHNCLCSN